jgi:RimJ/RimL family protein N-acetyltransferase
LRPPSGAGDGANLRTEVMLEPAEYSAVEMLRDGRIVEIRAIRPNDGVELAAAIDRSSTQSIYRRFFAVRRFFSDKEFELFSNVDFVTHVALVAVLEEDDKSTIVGGCRYIVAHPGTAEMAFFVVDRFQGKGIGAALMCHLAAIAHSAGLNELVADVLSDNTAMLKLIGKCGLRVISKQQPGVLHVTLKLRQEATFSDGTRHP